MTLWRDYFCTVRNDHHMTHSNEVSSILLFQHRQSRRLGQSRMGGLSFPLVFTFALLDKSPAAVTRTSP